MSAHIAWGMPNYGPIWAAAYETHMRAIAHASRHATVTFLGSVCGVGITDRMPLDMGENALVEGFLAIPHATHLFLTESDMLLPDETIEALLGVDKPIVSGVYFLRNGNGQPCLYKKVLGLPQNPYAKSAISIFPRGGPFKLNGCPGVGCVLIRREVFEGVSKPWFLIDPTKHGSDMYFYTKAVDAGFEVWVHPGVACGQIDYVVWNIDHYYDRLQHDPMFAQNGVIIGSEELARAAH